jgi:hypothetical protein
MGTNADQAVAPDHRPWDAFRRQMPVTERWAYFDHAAVAPLTAPARAALTGWAGDATENGYVSGRAWGRQVEQLRGLCARLIGAQDDEIALVRNTTEGINLVAEGFPWRPGDNCVTLADEFPSNQYPWMQLADRGVETRRVPTVVRSRDAGELAVGTLRVSTATLPEVAARRPARVSSNVVFPAPLGPTTPTTSPGATRQSAIRSVNELRRTISSCTCTRSA